MRRKASAGALWDYSLTFDFRRSPTSGILVEKIPVCDDCLVPMLSRTEVIRGVEGTHREIRLRIPMSKLPRDLARSI